MTEKLAWFPFYVRDWMTDEKVLAMTYAEQGVYLRLLCLQWLEGSIPASLARLERSLSLASSGSLGGTVEVPDLRGLVKDCFKLHPTLEGRLANPKLLQIAETQQLEAQKRAESGRKGGLRSAQARLKPGSTKTEPEIELTTSSSSAREASDGQDEVRQALPEDTRPIYDGYLRAARMPDAITTSIRALNSGLHASHPWPVLGRALVAMAAANVSPYNERALAGFARKIVEGDTPVVGLARPATRQERNEAAIDAWAAEEERKELAHGEP